MKEFYLVGRIVRGKFCPVHNQIDGKLIRKRTQKAAEKVIRQMIKMQWNSHDLAVGRVTVESVFPKKP